MRRPSFPTVISLIALFVALGGTSYAVIKLPAGSVGSRELKRDAVTGAKIRDGSVGVRDLALPARGDVRGPRGAIGPPGAPGAPGDAVAPEAWKPLPFAGTWSNYGSGFATGAYRRDARGRVYLRGLVTKLEGLPSQGEVIATLPPGYRPSAALIFPVASGHGAPPQVYGRLDVGAGGDIVWVAGGSGETDFTSLQTVSFWAD